MRTDQAGMFRLGSNHEFDLYFARAALEEMENGPVDPRRGSLPSAPPHQLIIKESQGPRRAASCKYPSRARRKGGSVSPRDQDGSPARVLPENDIVIPSSDAQIQSATPIEDTPPHQQLQIAPAPPVDHSLLAPEPRFDFKCHSAPHSRSSSWKKGRRPKSGTGDDSTSSRPRTGSVPLEDSISQRLEQLRLLQAEDCCVVRNFTISSKGLVNRGDSFKRKSISVASDHGSSIGSGLGDAEHGLSVHSVGGSTAASSCGPSIFKVALVGAHGVGKTSLVQQFMTSEYMGAMETSFDDEKEITVSVLLDGEETMLELYNIQPSTDIVLDEFDAYVIVYAITDRSSFLHALDLMNLIRKDKERHPAIILVANKSDLVRSRQITSDEGREVCLLKDCKYIEVSAALNHKVDDLLVGVVSQIRLQPQRMDRRRQKLTAEDCSDISCTVGAKGLLHKLFRRQHMVSKSCDNLLIL